MAWGADRTEQDQTLVIPSQSHENHGATCDFFFLGGKVREGNKSLIKLPKLILDLISYFFFPVS